METVWNNPANSTLPVPTNRELTVSLIGSIARFTLDVPCVLLGPEEITSRRLLIWLYPIVDKLGKLIERIRHVCQHPQQISIAPRHHPQHRSIVKGSSTRDSGIQHPIRLTPALSRENTVSNAASSFPVPEAPDNALRKVYIQRDGNYAIRETTDMRGANGTFQRVTKTISGPDVAILTGITSQLSALPSLSPV
ncbi:uncharacterized protein LOC131215501 [Anopheles bellator]|uniref:uncharacterized protein LOC131215501 n=1 Tax=Anopheles bellator TaxID=139047 RepID=UPI00264995B6|nr:uncharacterized protein LOC131215501 [Anopheles bellator]